LLYVCVGGNGEPVVVVVVLVDADDDVYDNALYCYGFMLLHYTFIIYFYTYHFIHLFLPLS